MSSVVEAWQLHEDDRPARGVPAQLHFLLRYAILAPSTHNSQPWKFRVGDDSIEIWSDSTRILERIDPDRRQLFMSCGAALANLRIAMRRFGNGDLVTYLPRPQRPDWLATIRLGAPHQVTERELALCTTILQRRTNREPYADRPISELLADEILAAAERPGAWMVRLHPHAKLEIAEVVAQADQQQLGDPTFRAEFAQWLAPRGSRRRDGIPATKKDLPTALPLAATLILRRFDIGAGVAARERELATNSPMLTVLGTDEDTPLAWLIAGEAMQDALLTATHLGVSASFLNQAIEEPALRLRVADATGRAGVPQLIMRWGYGPEIEPTPRRSLEDVVMES
jgi:Nitroreductase family